MGNEGDNSNCLKLCVVESGSVDSAIPIGKKVGLGEGG